MRLTLRTLLAYLDDVLEPAEAREIGKKLQESPLATNLVSRIREVMRRRRLGAPDLDGPGVGIDPNLVAQYLDNTLQPEQVVEIEKVFLESDQQLAEVAASHQIITLALGDPVEISQSSRERLYVLGPVDASEKLQTGESAHRRNGESSSKTPHYVTTVPGSAGASFEESLPEYLRPKSWAGKLIPIAIGIILLAVWLAAVISDQELKSGIKGLSNKSATKGQPAEPPPIAAMQPEPAQPQDPQPAVTVVGNTAPPPPDGDTPLPPPELPEGEAPPPADVTQTTPRPGKPRPEMPPQETTPPEPAPPEDVAVRRPAGVTAQYVSPEGVLLQRNPVDKSWYVLPKQSALKPGMMLACPEPYEAILDFDDGALRVTLLGDTVLEVLPSTATAPAVLHLLSGRIILHTARRAEKSWPLGFVLGPRRGEFEFTSGETLSGIEFLHQEPVSLEQPVPVAARPEGLYVLAGSLRWAPGDEPARVAGKGVSLKLLTDQLPTNFGAPAGSAPEWLDPQRRKVGSVLRRFAKQYEKEFELNQPIDSSMRALIRDPRSKIAELAVRCLALTGNAPAVVQAVAQSEHEDARKAALTGLKHWLGQQAERGKQLRQTLSTYYERPEQIDALYLLLWGLSEEDARKEQVSLDVVEWLRSDKVEIRELAFGNLVRLTGRKYDYRPLSSASQREPAVKRWFEHVQREGAILKAE